MRILVFTSWSCCSLVDIDTIAFHTSIIPLLSTFSSSTSCSPVQLVKFAIKSNQRFPAGAALRRPTVQTSSRSPQMK